MSDRVCVRFVCLCECVGVGVVVSLCWVCVCLHVSLERTVLLKYVYVDCKPSCIRGSNFHGNLDLN